MERVPEVPNGAYGGFVFIHVQLLYEIALNWRRETTDWSKPTIGGAYFSNIMLIVKLRGCQLAVTVVRMQTQQVLFLKHEPDWIL